MTRVIAGTAGGRRLKVPEGEETRPTMDRTKEALFGIIQFELDGVSFLDLFAGSGGIGIEALSRGASSCDFVESGREALSCIRANLSALSMQDRAKVWPMSVERAMKEMAAKGRKFDIIFLDPPYHQGWEQKTVQLAEHLGLLKSGGLLIAESSSDTEVVSDGFTLEKVKTYKTTRFSFFRA